MVEVDKLLQKKRRKLGLGVGYEKNRYVVGDKVVKREGYKYPGEVRAVFWTRAGNVRYVIEATGDAYAGMLHIFSELQIQLQKEELGS